MSSEAVSTRDAVAFNMRNKFGPFRWLRFGRLHDSKINGVFVGEHNEAIAPVINVILNIIATLAYNHRLLKGTVSRNQA